MTIGRIPSVEGGIQPTIVDAKGDLIAATAADTVNRLAVGSNDQVLVADSSASTGLAWKSVATPFAAGKNAIINGDFRINQRSFSSTTANTTYTFDRWKTNYIGGTNTYSTQTFTAGTAPVAGYEGTNFLRIVTTGQGANNYCTIAQPIEDVRTFAGQTIVVSFWVKANSGTPNINVLLRQNFGSGGSASTDTFSTLRAISTSWARYSFVITVPSISGKTIGTGSCTEIWIVVSDAFSAIGAQNNTFDVWGVQAEAGNVATPFQTATGTLQGELAACQRYYYKLDSATASDNYAVFATGYCANTTINYGYMKFPVTMRIAPSTSFSTTAANFAVFTGASTVTASNGTFAVRTTVDTGFIRVDTAGGMTAGVGCMIIANNVKTPFIEFSSEL